MALKKMPNTKTVLSTVASVAASAMLVRTIANDFLPSEIHDLFSSTFNSIVHRFSSEFTIVIDEFSGLSVNQVFEAVNVYLGTIMTPSTRRIKLGKSEDDKNVSITVDRDEEIVDSFGDLQVKWRLICTQVESKASNPGQHLRDLNATLRSEVRSYELTFHRKHKEVVMSSYLAHVMDKSKVIKEESKGIKLHTVDFNGYWSSNVVTLDHPMTFKNLAMDSELKKEIVEDLDKFMKGKEFYRRIGKAWKRGYLLYGPPGTGKSSLIAAMANYLNFDIYDVDLTLVDRNSDLRRLLLTLSSRSILIIEDIDCAIKLQNRESEDEDENNQGNSTEVTLSGLLNFIDGLWSCFGDERIIIFTTNHKDRLDPALLRPGRMDMHIHLSYCTFSAFKQLALNYLGVIHHQLFDKIEESLAKAEVTPAEVAGELMKNADSEASLRGLVKFLELKNAEKEKADISSTK